MPTKRVYKSATIYNARVVGMRNLWEPSTEFNGRPSKPSYMLTFIVKKTRQNWYEEPDFSDFTKAGQDLYNEAIAPVPFQQIDWPIKDGDVADPARGNPSWRYGHWLMTATSNAPVPVFININGNGVELKNRDKVKNGDYIGVNVALAVKMNDERGVKCYLNKVMFMAEGEEIVVGTSKSMTDMMADAKARGMNVTGFGSAGAPQQGFGQGFAQTPANPAHSPAPVPFPLAGVGGNASFPSNGPLPPPPTGFPSRS